MSTNTLEKAAKLNDVAKAAGVSQGTVSNVFNRPNLVREEVREHVRKVASQLGYRGPDPKGRLLRAGKVNAIGCATVRPLRFFFDDPFARVLMTGITEVCDARGAGISLVSAANEEELAWNIRSALVDALILFCLDDAERLIAVARERQLPFVALALGEYDDTISAVGVDNAGGARAIASHLAGLGHTRIGILALPLSGHRGQGPLSWEAAMASSFTTPRDRIIGYADALSARGVDLDAVPIFEAQPEQPAVEAALEQMFAGREPPTAIVALSDRIALFAIDWLKARGLSVPGDVSVAGFDGVREAETSTPPLTTVVQPIEEIGRRAVRAILDHPDDVQHVRLDVALAVRGSTAPPPGRR